MISFKRIFDFFILEVFTWLCPYTLVRMTHFMFHISTDQAMANFAFFLEQL
jgi:hypothetical protein